MGGIQHAWDLDPAAARALQTELAGKVECADRPADLAPRLTTVAGVDVGFPARDTARAAVVVCRWPSLEVIDEAVAEAPVAFPYVPGLLSFRELPVVLAAIDMLHRQPDLLLCDGQGRAHPRRFGIACHLGLWLDRPAIGVGKSRLVGVHDEPGRERGSSTPLRDDDEDIGAVVRTRTGVRPVFVSPGHRVCQATATAIVLAAAPRYRLPEPIRRADQLASRR